MNDPLYKTMLEEDFIPHKKKRSDNGKRANELDGKTWTRYSISVWSDIKKTPEEIKLGHPAIFPVQLPMRLIECFTNSDEEVILDPFVGSGATVLAAQKLGKTGIGFDVYEKFIQIADQRASQTDLFNSNDPEKIKLICDDSKNILKYIGPNSVDMVITSPPYWDVLDQKRTADYQEKRKYGDDHLDLGQISDYQKFISALKPIFEKVYLALKNKKYCVVNVMDLRKKSKFYPYHADIARMMEDIGFIFDDIIIWDRRHEYNNMRPLGYPSVFRINKAHEYLLIFQKPQVKNE